MISSGKINNKFIKMNIIENVNRLEDYLINESEISLIDIQKISTYLTNIREEAINYTRCCKSDSEQLHKLLQYLSDEDELIGNRTHQQIIDNFKKLV
jgi:hypothetical protein